MKYKKFGKNNTLVSFISYFTMMKEDRVFSLDLLIGLITVLFGICIYMFRLNVINLFPIIFGIWIIINNLLKLQLSINLSTIKNSGWIWLVLVSIVMILLGLLLIFNPFESMVTFTNLSCIFLLLTESVNLIESCYVLFKIKKI